MHKGMNNSSERFRQAGISDGEKSLYSAAGSMKGGSKSHLASKPKRLGSSQVICAPTRGLFFKV